MTRATKMTERYGNRRVPKMLAAVKIHDQLVRAEGTPSIQASWDEITQFIDYFYQEIGKQDNGRQDFLHSEITDGTKPRSK